MCHVLTPPLPYIVSSPISKWLFFAWEHFQLSGAQVRKFSSTSVNSGSNFWQKLVYKPPSPSLLREHYLEEHHLHWVELGFGYPQYGSLDNKSSIGCLPFSVQLTPHPPNIIFRLTFKISYLESNSSLKGYTEETQSMKKSLRIFIRLFTSNFRKKAMPVEFSGKTTFHLKCYAPSVGRRIK